jgi:cholesterol transport system auxiliary component
VKFSVFRDTGRRRGRRVKAFVPLLLLTSLAGCNGLFHSDARPEQVYYLRAEAAPVSEAGRVVVGASVRVGRPVATSGLDSPQIVLVQAGHRMSFFSASRWPTAVPDMVETLAIETLRASGSWTSVENSASPFPSDYLLQISVRRFEAEYSEGGGAPEVHVVLDCLIGRREGRDVVASFVAEGSSVAAGNKLSAVTAAFETAANSALGSLSERARGAVRAALERKSEMHQPP